MKKVIFSICAVLVACYVFATGTTSFNPATIVGPNAQQSGSFTITNLLPVQTTNTITFPYAFSTAPVMNFVVGNTTNAANNPLTNTITTTNFIVVTANSNAAIAWTANLGYPRVETGTNAGTATILVTNTFNPPFFYPPIMNVEGSSSNLAAVIGVTSVTTSNFIFTTSTTGLTVYWGAFGIASQPGVNVITY